MRKGIYLLPNLFTIANFGAGFFALINIFDGKFIPASWAILVAWVFDSLDGNVARLTKTTSKFGVEFDSLADIISFGLAPALLMYFLVLNNYGKVGILVAFIFVVAGALRLARFNVKSMDTTAPNIFYSGLPIPAAAGILATFVLVYSMFVQDTSSRMIPIVKSNMPLLYRLVPLSMLFLSYLMVSNLRYASFKGFKLNQRRSFRMFVFIIGAVLVIWMYPENMILLILLVYILSGVVDLLIRSYKIRQDDILTKKNIFRT
jgi:CDP-diacylglycerol---serine O-phosphatidyltransferase